MSAGKGAQWKLRLNLSLASLWHQHIWLEHKIKAGVHAFLWDMEQAHKIHVIWLPDVSRPAGARRTLHLRGPIGAANKVRKCCDRELLVR